MCGSESQGSQGKLFQGAQHSSPTFSLNFCLRGLSGFLLYLSDMLLTPSQQFCLGLFLLRSRASMVLPNHDPVQSICPHFALVFLTLEGERLRMRLVHIHRDRAGERTPVGGHLSRVLGASPYPSWNISMLYEHHGHEGQKSPRVRGTPHHSPFSVLAEGLPDWEELGGGSEDHLQPGKLLRG